MGTFFNLGMWLKAHWVELGVAAGYLVAAARLIVKLTPSPADDSALASVVAFLRHLGLSLPGDSSRGKEDA